MANQRLKTHMKPCSLHQCCTTSQHVGKIGGEGGGGGGQTIPCCFYSTHQSVLEHLLHYTLSMCFKGVQKFLTQMSLKIAGMTVLLWLSTRTKSQHVGELGEGSQTQDTLVTCLSVLIFRRAEKYRRGGKAPRCPLKETWPRLGAAITHVAVSPDGALFCTSHSDNSERKTLTL